VVLLVVMRQEPVRRDRDGPKPAQAMPVIGGIDVGSLLEWDKPMSPELTVKVIEQVAAALNAALSRHARGIQTPRTERGPAPGSPTVPITTIIAMVRLLLCTVVLVVCLAIGVLVASVLARHVGVGIGGGRGRVRAADGHKSIGSSQ
jgi:hypothetical protein